MELHPRGKTESVLRVSYRSSHLGQPHVHARCKRRSSQALRSGSAGAALSGAPAPLRPGSPSVDDGAGAIAVPVV